MSFQDLFSWLNTNTYFVFAYYLIILLLSTIGLFLFKNKQPLSLTIRYFYSVLVYLVALPGIFSFVLTLYSFFFLRMNLLEVDLIVYVLPIVASIIILSIINKTIKMAFIPGFERLSGLLILILIIGFVSYIFQKIFIGVFFRGSFTSFLVVFGLLFLGAKLALNKISK